jgi:predicted ester cyclase
MTEPVAVARKFMETYAAGDADGLLACLMDDWVLHEEDGSTTTRADIAEITRSHAEAFPEKSLEYLHELADGSHVAHHVMFTLIHSGPYHDLEPTGKHVVLGEMIFHRFNGDVISESWRMTYPDGVYALLAGRAAPPSG